MLDMLAVFVMGFFILLPLYGIRMIGQQVESYTWDAMRVYCLFILALLIIPLCLRVLGIN